MRPDLYHLIRAELLNDFRCRLVTYVAHGSHRGDRRRSVAVEQAEDRQLVVRKVLVRASRADEVADRGSEFFGYAINFDVHDYYYA